MLHSLYGMEPGIPRWATIVMAQAEPTVLQPYSSGDGRVRVKSSARAGGLLAGVTPFVVRRLGSVRACGRGWMVAGCP